MKSALQFGLGTVAWLACMACQAAGVLNLPNSEIWLEAGETKRHLHVENTGDAPLYLSVDQSLLENPGETPERLTPVGEVDKPGLLVMPRQLVLAPGQRYLLNLRVLGTPARTQVWRVTFYPHQRLVLKAGATSEAPPLSVNLGYGVVIYQLPVGIKRPSDEAIRNRYAPPDERTLPPSSDPSTGH